MADKEKKKASLFSSLRRNLVREGETRPMLPGSRPPPLSVTTPRRTENFEISLRDKSDATAKRGFRVQVPKRMLSYAVLVFIVAPLTLFAYMEVHRVATSHGHAANEKVEHHFHHDVLSLLTDGEEEEEHETNAVVNETVIDENAAIETGNATDTDTDAGDATSKNSTLENQGKDAVLNNSTLVETDLSNKTDVSDTDKKSADNGEKENKRVFKSR
jgi:hypothetical protein